MSSQLILLFSTVPIEEAKDLPWWRITTGILAIPAAIVGLAYSILLVKKTRLESRKIELEARKLDIELQKERSDLPAAGPSPQLLQPVFESRVILLLLLRALLLFLVLRAFGLVEEVYTLLTGGVFIAATKLFKTDTQNLWIILPFMLIQKLPSILYWVIFFAVGWPLFKDTNKVVGLNLRDFFSLRKTS